MSYSEEYKTAVHEASHFVLQVVGYECRDTNVATGATPREVSIIRNGDGEGHTRPDIQCIEEMCGLYEVDAHRRIWHIIRVLAGYATEDAYKLSNDYRYEAVVSSLKENYKWQDPNSDMDFRKALAVAITLIQSYDNSERDTISLTLDIWKYTVKTLKDKHIRKAIKYVTRQLLKHKQFDQDESSNYPKIKDLINGMFERPGVKEYRLKVPDITF